MLEAIRVRVWRSKKSNARCDSSLFHRRIRRGRNVEENIRSACTSQTATPSRTLAVSYETDHDTPQTLELHPPPQLSRSDTRSSNHPQTHHNSVRTLPIPIIPDESSIHQSRDLQLVLLIHLFVWALPNLLFRRGKNLGYGSGLATQSSFCGGEGCLAVSEGRRFRLRDDCIGRCGHDVRLRLKVHLGVVD